MIERLGGHLMASQGQPTTSALLLGVEKEQHRLKFYLASQLVAFFSIPWGTGDDNLKNFTVIEPG